MFGSSPSLVDACWECERHVRDIFQHLAVTEREHTGSQNFSDLHVSLSCCQLLFGILVFLAITLICSQSYLF